MKRCFAALCMLVLPGALLAAEPSQGLVPVPGSVVPVGAPAAPASLVTGAAPVATPTLSDADSAAPPAPDAAAPASVNPDTAAPASVNAEAASPEASASPDAKLSGSKTLVEKLREQPTRQRDAAPSVMTMLGGLVMTLGLLFTLAWLARRLRLNVPGMSSGMRLEAAVALGPREKLCVVSRAGKVYVLGVTQQSVTLIDTETSSTAEAPVSDTQFSDRIKKLLQNGAPHGT